MFPLCAILIYSSYEQKKQAIDFAKENALRVANSLALQQKFVEENTRQTLRILSEIPEIKSENPKNIYILLHSLMKQNLSYASLLLVDKDGNMIASGDGISKFNVGDQKYFKDVIKNKTFSVGEYTHGRLSNKQVIHYACPVFQSDSTIQSVIIVSFDLKTYDTIFNTFNLGKDAIFTFVDHNGTIIYNSPNSDIKTGSKGRSDLIKHLTDYKQEDSFISTGNDGIKRLYGISSLNLPQQKTYITILVGVPFKTAIAGFIKTLTNYAIIWVLAGLFIILFAYIFSVKAIVKPIDKLVTAAGLIANGNLNAQSNIKNSFSELGKLGATIDEMTFKLQQRETERNMALKDLKKLKERFELAVNSANIGIFDWHIPNNKLIWNKNMFALYGIDADTFSGQIDNWFECIHPNDKDLLKTILDTAIEKIQPFQSEFRIKLPNKSIKCIRLYGDVILDKKSKPVRLIGVNWDITEQKNWEHKLNDAREKAETSDKLKSAFLANISHEIRTPLHGIIGFAQILKNSDTSNQEKIQYLDIIIHSGNKLQNIISNIIDISLLDANQLNLIEKESDIPLMLKDLYTTFTNQKIQENKSFDFILEDMPTPQKPSIADEFRIKQVFSNLLDNAFKFTDYGEIRFGYNYDKDQLVFFVKDTGIGISKKNSLTIFDRFKQIEYRFNRNYSGTGLGLAICKGLIELMGGKIWLERKNKGTDFYFSVPIKTEKSINVSFQKEKADFSLN
jgi:signal transduction histidine kinase/HAMP domain-containing protein